jgi:quinol monooxygenase YgiN
MIVVLGQFDFHPEDFETAKALAATLMEETARENGCLKYAFAADLVQPNRLQLGELWRDDASLAAHFLTPHIQAYRAGLSRLRVVNRSVQRHEVTSTRDL